MYASAFDEKWAVAVLEGNIFDSIKAYFEARPFQQSRYDKLEKIVSVGQTWRKPSCCSFEQRPITYSTPARLYQLRSKITISPAAGKCCMWIWCKFS
jgi:hypothetical protein